MFSKTIIELEKIFEKNRTDLDVLLRLKDELECRRSARAARLRAKAGQALGAIQAKTKEPNAAEIPIPSEKPTRRPARGRVYLDQPSAILAAWTALEALSPQTYRRPEDLISGDSRCAIDLSETQPPWIAGEKSRPNYRLYYQIILGSVLMERAANALAGAFGEAEEPDHRNRDKAALATVLVDKCGIPVENGISVSSFAWALTPALKLKFEKLGAWQEVEPKIIEKLETIFRRSNHEGLPIPIDLDAIHRAHDALVAEYELPGFLTERTPFALRIYHYYKAKNPPEAALLNSFFLRDLARAADRVKGNTAPPALDSYFGNSNERQTFDLLHDTTALEEVLAPSLVSAAKWPAGTGHALVTLQQAAVNIVRSECRTGGLAAVNGPPGTGKTTLLRDLVAACVLDRAEAMARFEDPGKAFQPSGKRAAIPGNKFFHLYKLDPRLKGHEILVASSNNKAVENISRELPAQAALGDSANDLRYFKTVSDAVRNPTRQAGIGGEEEECPAAETWGLIAAVLGNVQNRNAFRESFWWDDERSFRLYLKAAKGDPTLRKNPHPEGGETPRGIPRVILDENPPSPQLAKGNWEKARERLLTLKQEVDSDMAFLEGTRKACLQLAEDRTNEKAAQATLSRLIAERVQLDARLAGCRAAAAEAHAEHSERSALVSQHRKTRPSLFARIFRTEGWRTWAVEDAPLRSADVSSARILQAANESLSKATALKDASLVGIRQSEQVVREVRKRIAGLSKKIEDLRPLLGDRIVDSSFFNHHETWNLAIPWIPPACQEKREKLFAAAINVHRAFIDCAAQKIYHNLSALMQTLSSGADQTAATRDLLGDLWSTLFLVIPVISTTFASVDRMLGDLPADSFGWLLIDEAGQALPQAAVGAIMRSRRCVVVGDPLQIPPITSLPERLVSYICDFFNVDAYRWAAPESSVQTLADRASKFQGTFSSNDGLPRRVGAPLLVHRRCEDPMFKISNAIAYEGLMVKATVPPPFEDSIHSVLGPSAWFDIDGEAHTKWCQAEGDVLLTLLKKLAGAGLNKPDIFTITPFRAVAQEIRIQLDCAGSPLQDLSVDPRQWVKDRVGTIHTFQGREAAAVILVLGAPNASQSKAREWAAGTPNILNVAVSRAKRNLYVIGSVEAWGGTGHARTLASHLPKVRLARGASL
jgi:hypothetical protein